MDRLATFILVLAAAAAAAAADLDERLGFLEPLTGAEWTGGYVGEKAPDIDIVLTFEPILDGAALRYVREAPAVGFTSETRFYWLHDPGEVRFVNLNNRGIVGEGVATFEKGAVVLRGVNTWAEESFEFVTTLEIKADGMLRDTFDRKEDGAWVRGHVQEFAAGDLESD
jgi:hypothetical protein